MLSNPRRVVRPISIRFVGFETLTPSSFSPDHDPAGTHIQDLFHTLREAIASFDFDLPAEVYGISCPADDANPPQLIRYFAGIPTPDVDVEGLEEITVTPGAYFAVTYEGTIGEFDRAINEIYGPVFSASGYEFREGLHLEIYPANWDPQDPNARMDVLIPISSTEGNEGTLA
jgi:predicted transcriptional regulator YdeE